VSLKQGDEELKEHNNEERQTGNPGNMPSVWHQDVQNWQELDLLGHGRQNSKGLDFPGIGMSSPFILRITLSKQTYNEHSGRSAVNLTKLDAVVY
jgi:hypothetical protein